MQYAGLIVATLLVLAAFSYSRRRRQRRIERARLFAQPFPDVCQETLRRRVRLYRRLPPAIREEIHGHMQVLWAEKTFVGCNDFVVTDEVRLIILFYAALLLSGRSPRYYPALDSILVYPEAFYVDVEDAIGDGFTLATSEARAGESWQYGQVILSWQDILESLRQPGEGFNVVIHEFAHQLDQETGDADGMPRLAPGQSPAEWRRVMGAAYDRLCAQIDADEPTVVDDYGAEGPGEFFAVASETFFECPEDLRHFEPELYDLLRAYYGLDPAAWR